MLAMMWGNTAFPPRALAKRSSEVSPAIALLQERPCRTDSTTCGTHHDPCIAKYRHIHVHVAILHGGSHR